jgi:Protein of unknown function (DUF3300)
VTNKEAGTMARLSRLIMIVLLWSMPLGAEAQTAQPATAPEQAQLKTEELDQLLAPIALYPDPLLSQVLIASTYPLEVVQAERWATQNKNLQGDRLKTEAGKQAWDDSVKSLVATPSVLTMMSTKLDWTQKLGDAILAQQADVMDAIQRLRSKAHANNKLASTKEQKVTVKQEQNKQVIAIEPAVPDTIYVPYYDPAVVYGGWPYPAYPPYYWPAPGYIAGGIIATGIAFGAGYALGRWTSGGNWWGGGINWNNNNINVNRPINNIDVKNWQHNPDHRHGVKYNNADVRQKFARTDAQAGKAARQDFRGKDGQKVLDPDRGRPGAGDRPGASDRDRPGAGARDRPGAGDRDRPGASGDRDRPGAGDRDRAGAGDRDRPGAGKDRPQARDAGARDASRDGGKQAGGKQAGPKPASHPSGGAQRQRDTAFSGVQSGQGARAQADRGRQSFHGGGGGQFAGGGGGPRVGGGPSFGGGRGGFSGGGGGFRGGGGRRSDVALKHDITFLGRLDNGLGFYRFSYDGSDRAYVGVMAQEVQTIMPEAVVRGRDGYLRVLYDKLGLKFQTYDRWIAAAARVPTPVRP